MEKIAEKLAKLLLKEKLISESMLEIYQYGLVRMLEIGGAFLTSLVICFGMGMIKEGILFFAFFVPLRSYLGGFHLQKYWQCYIMSCLTLVLVLIITRTCCLDMRVSVGVTIAASIGIGLETKWEQKEMESIVYSFVVWVVLAILLVVMGFCIAWERESALVVLSCVTSIVLGSKVLEQILRYKKHKWKPLEGENDKRCS